MGYNDIEHLRVYFFYPALPQEFANGIPYPYPPVLQNVLNDYALGYPVEPLDSQLADDPNRSSTLRFETLYLFPHLQRTNVRKKNVNQSYAISVPDVFLKPKIGRVFCHAKGDPSSITRTRNGDVSIHLEPERVPYTLLFDSSGNLFYFWHYIYGGTAYVPTIPGVAFSP